MDAATQEKDATKGALAAAPEVLTLGEVCDLLRVKRDTLRELIRDGLPCAEVGRRKRFLRADILDWLRSQCAT